MVYDHLLRRCKAQNQMKMNVHIFFAVAGRASYLSRFLCAQWVLTTNYVSG